MIREQGRLERSPPVENVWRVAFFSYRKEDRHREPWGFSFFPGTLIGQATLDRFERSRGKSFVQFRFGVRLRTIKRIDITAAKFSPPRGGIGRHLAGFRQR